jgi:hypothetical protein
MSDKPTPKSDKYFFVGYLNETKGYYFYNKAESKVFVAHNGVFMGKSFWLKELVGARYNLKKFKKHLKLFQNPLIPYRKYKIFYRQMLKHQPHVGL